MNNNQILNSPPLIPFPGIEPFTYQHRSVFFAREQEIRKLIRLIVINRGVLLYSGSGIGKSSLINAGLIPSAIAEGFHPERIRVQPKKNEEIVIEQIDIEEERANSNLSSIFSNKNSNEQIVLSVENFQKIIENKLDKYYPLFIFDQFEEIITLFETGNDYLSSTPSLECKAKIVQLITSLVNNDSMPVKILLVFREDYLAKLKQLFNGCPNLLNHFFQLNSLSSEQIYQIILKPFQNFPQFYKPPIEPELAQLITKQFQKRNIGISTPLSEVQIVCRTLYEAGLKGNNLTSFFNQMDGVQGILEHYLESAITSLPIEQHDPAINLLRSMLTSEGTRNVISREDLINRVIEIGEQTDKVLLDQTLNNLESKTRLIQRERRRDIYLYEITSEFLIPWIEKQEKERKIFREQQKRIEAQQKAEEQIRVARRLKRLMFALIFVSILAIISTIYAWQQMKSAQKNERKAITSQNYAEEQKIRAEEERDSANFFKRKSDTLLNKTNDLNLQLEIALDSSENRKNRAFKFAENEKRSRKNLQINTAVLLAHSLAALIPELKNTEEHDIIALLARQAFLFNQDYEGMRFNQEIYNALLLAFDEPEINYSCQNVIHSIEFDPSGASFVTGDERGNIYKWNFSNSIKESRPKFIGKHDRTISGISFHPGGKIFASVSEDMKIKLWNLEDINESPTIISQHTDRIWAVSFTPDGEYLATAGADSTLFLWKFDNFKIKLDRSIKVKSWIRSLAFSPIQDWLAIGLENGEIGIMGFTQRENSFHFLSISNRPILSLQFSPINSNLAMGCEDNKIYFYDGKNLKQKPLYGHSAPINSLKYSNDGKLLISGSLDGTIRIWKNLTNFPEFLEVNLSPNNWLQALAISRNNHFIIAASNSRKLFFWTVQPSLLSERVCFTVKRNLSQNEWDKYIGSFMDYNKTCPHNP